MGVAQKAARNQKNHKKDLALHPDALDPVPEKTLLWHEKLDDYVLAGVRWARSPARRN